MLRDKIQKHSFALKEKRRSGNIISYEHLVLNKISVILRAQYEKGSNHTIAKMSITCLTWLPLKTEGQSICSRRRTLKQCSFLKTSRQFITHYITV